MEASQKSKSKPTTKRYPPELKQRAVRMVLEARALDPQDQGCVARIARQLGVGEQSLRDWVNQADTDRGKKADLTTEERERLKTLENRELKRSNEMAG